MGNKKKKRPAWPAGAVQSATCGALCAAHHEKDHKSDVILFASEVSETALWCVRALSVVSQRAPPHGDKQLPAVTTNNGREFENEILRDAVKLLRIRHGFTPPYHPRGNYTERVNRCIGEWLRALVNTKSARKRDTKFVGFAYNSMFIPGTNISPYMASTGRRQPLVPQDVFFMYGNGPPNVGDAPYKPLTEHVTELKADLEAARQEVQAARDKALEKQRVEFNAERIEEVFTPGEMIRYFNDKEPQKSALDGGENEVVIGEISKLKLKNKLYEVVEQLSPTTYSLSRTPKQAG